MNKLINSILIVALLSSISFSSDCEQLKLDLRKETIKKPVVVGCFAIASCLAGYSLLLLTTQYRPAPNGGYSGPTEKEKIFWGIVGIAAGLSYSIEIPVFVKSIKKSKRIKEELNTNCNSQKY